MRLRDIVYKKVVHAKDQQDALKMTDQNFSNLTQSVQNIGDVPLLNGLIIDVEFTSATAIEVSHKLGRKWVGYLVISKDADANLYHVGSTRDKKTITLRSTASCVYRLWVF